MYLVYVPSKDQLPSATRLGSETHPAKDLKSIFAHQDCFGGRVFQENMLRGHVFLMHSHIHTRILIKIGTLTEDMELDQNPEYLQNPSIDG